MLHRILQITFALSLWAVTWTPANAAVDIKATPFEQRALQGQRQKFQDEIRKDPNLRLRWGAMMLSEQTGDARITVGETMVNRANAWGKSLSEILANKAYYEPHQNGSYERNMKRIKEDAELRRKTFQQQDVILGGSNRANLATHNGSAGVAAKARKTQTVRAEESGEVYTIKIKNPKLHGEKTVRREKHWFEATAQSINIFERLASLLP